MTSFTPDKISNYFKGKVMSLLTNHISDKITQDKISILNINSYLLDISSYIEQAIQCDFEKYGITIENFMVMAVSIPEDDPSFLALKKAKDFAARLKIMGKDAYQMERSFDVLDKAAANEGNNSMINMGVGLGAGLNIGNQIGNTASQILNASTPPPVPVLLFSY